MLTKYNERLASAPSLKRMIKLSAYNAARSDRRLASQPASVLRSAATTKAAVRFTKSAEQSASASSSSDSLAFCACCAQDSIALYTAQQPLQKYSLVLSDSASSQQQRLQ